MSDPLLPVLRAELRRAGLTQAAVAAKMQVSSSHLGQMLGGYRGMSLPMLRRLLGVLDCDLILARPMRADLEENR